MNVLSRGPMELLVLSWPPDTTASIPGLCIPVMKREGGVLVAVPNGFVPVPDLQGAAATDLATVGPHTVLEVPAVIMEGDTPQAAGVDVDVLLVDLDSAALGAMVPYALSTATDNEILGFGADLAVLPDPVRLLALAREWVEASGDPVAFYSAEEGALPQVPEVAKAKPKAAEKKRGQAAMVADHITSMSKMLPQVLEQLSNLQEDQRRLQSMVEQQGMTPPPRGSQMPVSMPLQNFARLMGTPPRTKHLNVPPPPAKVTAKQPAEMANSLEEAELAQAGMMQGQSGNVLAQAVLQQSQALTTLVTHLQSGGDPLLDHQGTSSSLSSRGAAGREKLQRDLAQRSGGFFLQVMQNAFRRVRPATPMPPSCVEIAAADFSMIHYLERCGGYGNSRELGLIMYLMSFVADAAIREDWEGVKEHLALCMVSVEQAAQDSGRWDLAFQLSLAEDPPSQIFSYKSSSVQTTGRARAFSSLCPQKWATVALAYAKEMDYIQSRRQETSAKHPAAEAQQGSPTSPSPKRRGRYPKAKPGGAASSQDANQEQK